MTMNVLCGGAASGTGLLSRLASYVSCEHHIYPPTTTNQPGQQTSQPANQQTTTTYHHNRHHRHLIEPQRRDFNNGVYSDKTTRHLVTINLTFTRHILGLLCTDIEQLLRAHLLYNRDELRLFYVPKKNNT